MTSVRRAPIPTRPGRTSVASPRIAERLYQLEVERGTRKDEQIAVLCYQWDEEGFSDRRGFEPEQVNVLARRVKENLSLPHRFICITDETEGFSDDVELMPLPEEARAIAVIPTAQGRSRFPSCYRRLWTFSNGAKALGDVVLVLDIDCFITGLLDPLFDFMPHADFVGWNPVQAWGKTKVGGGTWRIRPGTRTHIWEKFSQQDALRIKNLGFNGSDQAILSFYLGDEPVFPQDWILNRQDMRRLGGTAPEIAKIVHCNGPQNMKGFLKIEDVPWVR